MGFYNLLNMEGIHDKDQAHPKRVSKDYEVKNLHYELYVQSDASLLVDVFERFWIMCLQILFLEFIDSACLLTAETLTWQTALRNT